ncbi:SpoVA/SpoVAEb family sporulation membrane protein, partial [Bacillus sp. JJ1764]|uniref:SpoVA/SpoVAEb family sporulation membrane protein n=1 Tax=Bacillus sp. JJ1764 TaxID=3122964 RepID=UPI002FFE8E1A
MASKQKEMTPQQQSYQQLQQKHEKKRPVLKNCIKAFFVGGLFCVVGQAISYFYIYFLNFTEQSVG